MGVFFNEQDENYKPTHETDVLDESIFNQEAAENAIAEWKQKYAYLSADFENFKRRSLKEYEATRIEIYARILKPLLVIMDDFDRAYEAAEKQKSDIEGFKLIGKSLAKVLADSGVVEMPMSTVFDPEKHEALLQVESSEHKPGDIVSVLQKGYILQGVVLRPAKVSVAQ